MNVYFLKQINIAVNKKINIKTWTDKYLSDKGDMLLNHQLET